MKKCILKYSLVIFILQTSVSAYSQSENKTIYYPNNIEIKYLPGSLGEGSKDSVGKNIKPDDKELSDVNTISFKNDTLINVSGKDFSNVSLNINKINSIRVHTGSYTALGIGLGVLGGAGITAIVALSTQDNDQNVGVAFTKTIGIGVLGFLSILGGAVIGGIIGGNIDSYETYDLKKAKNNKKNELERIMKIDEKENRKK